MTEILLVLVLISPILGFMSWYWISGIDYMKKNYPDYKGEDLFDESSISKTCKKRKF